MSLVFKPKKEAELYFEQLQKNTAFRFTGDGPDRVFVKVSDNGFQHEVGKTPANTVCLTDGNVYHSYDHMQVVPVTLHIEEQ
ncbi:hypothetical protein [Methyloversatilis sp.]|uniref:hypothetical protein n=1 Tax=Methyloversatilis sp. TaxID=2569862 RepID=UPI0035B31522